MIVERYAKGKGAAAVTSAVELPRLPMLGTPLSTCSPFHIISHTPTGGLEAKALGNEACCVIVERYAKAAAAVT